MTGEVPSNMMYSMHLNPRLPEESRSCIRTGSCAILTALILASAVSCSTFPIPDKPMQNLVIVPLSLAKDFQLQSEGIQVAMLEKAELFYGDLTGKEIGSIVCNPKMRYAVFVSRPGNFRFTGIRLQFRNRSGGTPPVTKEYPLYLPFAVADKTVSLLTYEAVVVRDDGQEKSGVAVLSRTRTIDPAGLLSELRKKSGWASWEGFTLVNFE